MVTQDNTSDTKLAILRACKRYLKKRFSIEWRLEAIPQNYMLEFLEDEVDLKVQITEENTLYGYHISGGGAIDKFPRFRTRERAELDAIRLIINLLENNVLALNCKSLNGVAY